jgi:hypothetical protein
MAVTRAMSWTATWAQSSAATPHMQSSQPLTAGSGHDYIRQRYERVVPPISSRELMSSIQVLGEVLYLTFRAQHDGRDELIGTEHS